MGHKIRHLPFCSYFQKWSEKNDLEGIVGYPRTFTIILTNEKKIPARTSRMSQTASVKLYFTTDEYHSSSSTPVLVSILNLEKNHFRPMIKNTNMP